MKTQTLHIRSDKPVSIPTPLGMIRIFRGPRGNRVQIELPDSLMAYVDPKRAVSASRWFDERDGGLTPTFRFLVPQVDDKGHLIGVVQPDSLKVEAQHV